MEYYACSTRSTILFTLRQLSGFGVVPRVPHACAVFALPNRWFSRSHSLSQCCCAALQLTWLLLLCCNSTVHSYNDVIVNISLPFNLFFYFAAAAVLSMTVSCACLGTDPFAWDPFDL